MNKMLVGAVALLMCSLALPSLADEGRIPVHTAPAVLADSGKYVLTRNLLPVAGNPSIVITAPVVDLDLNGFVVEAGTNQVAIRIRAESDVVIRNGTLLVGGIATEFAGGIKRIVIEDVQLRDVLGTGIDLHDVLHVTLRRNVLVGATLSGIVVASSNPWTGIIEENVVRDVEGDGMNLSQGNNLTIRGNQLYTITGGGRGIQAQGFIGCQIERNSVNDTEGPGIRLSHATNVAVTGNIIHSATDYGLYADNNSSHLSYVGNVITRTDGDAIHLNGADYAVLRDNNMTFNDGLGLNIRPGSGDTVYYGNVAQDNCGGGTCPCLPASVTDFCDEGMGSKDGGGNFMP